VRQYNDDYSRQLSARPTQDRFQISGLDANRRARAFARDRKHASRQASSSELGSIVRVRESPVATRGPDIAIGDIRRQEITLPIDKDG